MQNKEIKVAPNHRQSKIDLGLIVNIPIIIRDKDMIDRK